MSDIGPVREGDPENDPLVKIVSDAVDQMKEAVEEITGKSENMACVIFLLEDIVEGDSTDAVVCHAEPELATPQVALQIALDGTKALAEGLGIKLQVMALPVGKVGGQG